MSVGWGDAKKSASEFICRGNEGYEIKLYSCFRESTVCAKHPQWKTKGRRKRKKSDDSWRKEEAYEHFVSFRIKVAISLSIFIDSAVVDKWREPQEPDQYPSTEDDVQRLSARVVGSIMQSPRHTPKAIHTENKNIWMTKKELVRNLNKMNLNIFKGKDCGKLYIFN